MGKHPLFSKTINTNTLAAVVGIITAVAGQEWVAAYPRLAAGLATALAVLNVILRCVTTEPLEL